MLKLGNFLEQLKFFNEELEKNTYGSIKSDLEKFNVDINMKPIYPNYEKSEEMKYLDDMITNVKEQKNIKKQKANKNENSKSSSSSSQKIEEI